MELIYLRATITQDMEAPLEFASMTNKQGLDFATDTIAVVDKMSGELDGEKGLSLEIQDLPYEW